MARIYDNILETIGRVKRFQSDWDCRHRMKQRYVAFEKTSMVSSSAQLHETWSRTALSTMEN